MQEEEKLMRQFKGEMKAAEDQLQFVRSACEEERNKVASLKRKYLQSLTSDE